MLTVRDATGPDTDWILKESGPLGGPEVVAGGMLHRLADYPAVIAEQDGEPVGFAVFRSGSHRWEILGILSVTHGTGIGSKLLDEVESRARESGAAQVRLSTTNDNFEALGFCQKRGYRMRQLIPGAFEEAKRLKGIPKTERVIGASGIEITDEIILNKNL